ncbi:hypothetical protein WMF18_02305 [Sorangium sp. So ce315]|uniref:hypothetical protein n=1 Tax=Sorangium sp. So ce315 TaxID=3133299 RepID=UPI003F617123
MTRRRGRIGLLCRSPERTRAGQDRSSRAPSARELSRAEVSPSRVCAALPGAARGGRAP